MAEPEHGIGWAMRKLQRGHVVRRGAWGGTIRTLTLLNASGPSPSDGFGFAPLLAVRTQFDCYAAWTPAHADLLAKDWEIAP